MELSSRDGKLNILYGDRLVTLLREVRQLKSYGFPIPKDIDECAQKGQKYLKHGMILKQVKMKSFLLCVNLIHFISLMFHEYYASWPISTTPSTNKCYRVSSR